jgi:hypothetical protein
MTIVVVTIVLTLAQVVSLGTLPNLPASKTPLADASALHGRAGAAHARRRLLDARQQHGAGARDRAAARSRNRAICARLREGQSAVTPVIAILARGRVAGRRRPYRS